MRIAIDWRAFGRHLALFSAIAAFMAFINPYRAAGFESYIFRFFYWGGLIYIGGLSGTAGIRIAERIQQTPHWAFTIFTSAVTASIAVTAAIYLFEAMRRGVWDIPLSELPMLFVAVMVISLAIASVSYLVSRLQEVSSQHAIAASDTANPEAKFLERLPVKFRTAELYAVSSEDHYLRVHTSLGEELILMRLADAMRELTGADGLQTHRSWWVARAGVSDVRKDNGKMTLVLKSGGEAPVSRTYNKAVRDASLAA